MTPDDAGPPYLPDGWQSVRLLVVGFVLFAVPGWLVARGLQAIGAAESLLPLSPVVSLGTLWLGKRWTGRPWRDVLPVGRLRASWLPGFLAGTAGVYVVSHLLGESLAQVAPVPGAVEALFQQLTIAEVVVVAPLVEEGLFRGLLLGGYVRAYGPARAIALCAVVFAAWHLVPWQFPVALVAGAWFSWLAIASTGLLLPILAHALVNAAGLAGIRHPEVFVRLAPSSPTAWFVGVFLLLSGALYVRRTVRASRLPTLTMVEP